MTSAIWTLIIWHINMHCVASMPSWHTWYLRSWFSPDTGQLLEKSGSPSGCSWWWQSVTASKTNCTRSWCRWRRWSECRSPWYLSAIQIFKLTLNVGTASSYVFDPVRLDRKYFNMRKWCHLFLRLKITGNNVMYKGTQKLFSSHNE